MTYYRINKEKWDQMTQELRGETGMEVELKYMIVRMIEQCFEEEEEECTHPNMNTLKLKDRTEFHCPDCGEEASL